jgi:hypothetical protein
MRCRYRSARFYTVLGCALSAAFVASAVSAQEPIDVETRDHERRIIELELAPRIKAGENIGRFGKENLSEVVDDLKKELADTKADVARLGSELESLRAEVRALNAKPGETPTLTLRAPFAVIDAAGRELMRVGEGNDGTRIASRLAVTAANNRSIVEMTAEGLTATGRLTVNTPAGRQAAVLDARADNQASLIFLAGTGAESASMGVGDSGIGFLEVKDPGGSGGVNIGATESKMGVYVTADEGKVQASVGLDDMRKGIVRVGDPTAARGVIGATRTGGVSFALYDGPGTEYRVGLLAAPDNSFVRLNSKLNAVHMNADGEGAAVHVFNKQGNAAGSLTSTTSGFGQLRLGNSDGDTVVEAGTTVDGLGVVRAGPLMGGTVGMEGLPFAIMGKK